MKENLTYEQPVVEYRYNTIVELNGQSVSSTNADITSALNIYYSSSPTLSALNQEYLRYPILQSNEVDQNLDGKVDQIEVNLQFPITAYESITTFRCFIYYNLQFNDKTKYVMDAGTYFTHSSAVGMSSVEVNGDLELRQKHPMAAKGGYVL